MVLPVYKFGVKMTSEFLDTRVYPNLINKFYGLILMGIKNISQKLTNQVFFLTHLLSWNGITGSGLNVLSKFGYLMLYRIYLNHYLIFERKYNRRIREVIVNGVKMTSEFLDTRVYLNLINIHP